MIEAFLLAACGGCLTWIIWNFCDAGAGGWGGSTLAAEVKWGINPRVMRWLLPLIAAGVAAYIGYLKALGLI